MKLPVCFVFDIDDTLIHIDKNACNADGYSKINFIGYTPLFRVFRYMIKMGMAVYCLTNRDPSLQIAYARLLGIPPIRIMCRTFETLAEVGQAKIVELNKDPAWVDQFLVKMFREKRDRLVEKTVQFLQVVYFDDLKGSKHWPTELDDIHGLFCIPWTDVPIPVTDDNHCCEHYVFENGELYCNLCGERCISDPQKGCKDYVDTIYAGDLE